MHPLSDRPSAGLLAAQGLATLRAYFVFFNCYQSVMLFLDMVCLTVASPADAAQEAHLGDGRRPPDGHAPNGRRNQVPRGKLPAGGL
jgi:hypothetical protein